MGPASLIAVAALLAAAVEIRVETIDGASRQGQLETWTSEGMGIVGEALQRSDAMVRVDFIRPTADTPQSGRPRLTLTDQSGVEFDSLESVGDAMRITVENVPDVVSLPKSIVRSVTLIGDNAAADERVQEALAAGTTADVLIVGGGESYEQYEGVIGDITNDIVRFKLDDDWLDVRREKVAGVVFYRRNSPAAKAGFRVLGDGLNLLTRDVALSGDRVRLTSIAGLELDVPLRSLRGVDYSLGKVAYLSDLERLRDEFQPLVPLPPAATFARQASGSRIDRGFWQDRLSLRRAVRRDDRIVSWRRIHFDRGLAMRSRSELEFRLPEGFGRFSAIVGIDADVQGPAEVVLEIRLDGQTVYRETISAAADPQTIEIDLRNAARLTLAVDSKDRGSPGDRIYICNPRLIP